MTKESGISSVASTRAPEPRLVACPSCGAPNAASRVLCARCKDDLNGRQGIRVVSDGDAADGLPQRPGPSRMVVVAVVIAILAGIGVMVAILSAQGIGPFAPDVADVLVDAETADVIAVRASSERDPSDGRDFAADNVLDDSAETAWVAAREAPGWIEMDLGREQEIIGLVVWNGYQASERFSRHDRVSSLIIETGQRRFQVDLLDTRGPLAVDLPEPVTASRVRLIAEEVFSGDEVAGPALSVVEVRIRP